MTPLKVLCFNKDFSLKLKSHWSHVGGLQIWVVGRWWVRGGKYCCRKTFFKIFTFLMWTTFKVFIEFLTILHLLHVLVFWPQGLWDLSSPIRDQTHIPSLEGEVLTPGPPGKSQKGFFKHHLNYIMKLHFLCPSFWFWISCCLWV